MQGSSSVGSASLPEESGGGEQVEQLSSSAFRADMAAIPQVQGEIANVGVAVFEPTTLERGLMDQYDRAVSARETQKRAEFDARLERDRHKIEARLQTLQEQLMDATGDKAERLEQMIATQREKLRKIAQEEEAEEQLKAINNREQQQQQQGQQQEGRQEELVSAGLLTPFEAAAQNANAAQSKKLAKADEAAFKVMMRKGTWVDDTDDADYARRIELWKSGRDVQTVEELLNAEAAAVEGEAEEEAPEGAEELSLDLEDMQEKGDDEEEAEPPQDGGNVWSATGSGAANDDFDEEAPVVYNDVEEDAAPVGFCDKCRSARGVSQVLEVMGKASIEDSGFDLPQVLKDCRGNAQRVLELIFADEEGLKKRYPLPRRCDHLSEQRIVQKPRKEASRKRTVDRNLSSPASSSSSSSSSAAGRPAKRMFPEPLALPAAQISLLDDGQLASVVVDDKFRVPLETYDCLFEYQRTGVRWLWELHKFQVGGILADEMGLGKTVQLITFLYGLWHSSLLQHPTILICPSTVMKQWVSEFHKWAPPFRVIMIHASTEARNKTKEFAMLRALNARGTGVVVTTYEAFRRNKALFLPVQWSYAVLDEGHKIRNPDADITLTCKQLNTHRRILLTGTPIQNSLKELWSLMDFVYPGKLGTLPVFQREFEAPIQQGGYASASPSQVVLAYRCSVVLRDLIKPYLLRRLKMDVEVFLPDKKEHVMMCRLTPEQVKAYRSWINSDEVQRILDGKLNALYGISFLRKICNHPDLLKLGTAMTAEEKAEYGNYERSAKMLVLHEMLPLWKREGHRVLIFSQGVQMLDIITTYIRAQGYSYLRMDGTTSVKQRVPMIDQFNSDESIFVFLLTTRVGGIGVNLTGANRVVIFDPDWNPSTDMQARERAWRIGQRKAVCVYRLVTAGTIEEKVLQRQIYKTFLTHKVLKDPRQRRLFNGKDLADLFTLGREYSGNGAAGGNRSTETSRIFKAVDEHVDVAAASPRDAKRRNVSDTAERDDDVLLQSLLAKNERLVSALNHEAMVDSSQRPEYALLQKQGEEAAKRAVDNLKRSQQLVAASRVTIPTWTGRRGEAGVAGLVQPKRFGRGVAALVPQIGDANVIQASSPNAGVGAFEKGRIQVRDSATRLPQSVSSSPSGGASSSALLSSIKSKADANSAPLDDNAALLEELRRFLWANGGRCDSDQVVAAFSKRMKTPEQKFVLRSILREIATFDKNTKVWTAKEEYR